MKTLPAALAALALFAACSAHADELDVGKERERIKAERHAAEARFAAEQKACGAKFAVNDCVDAAKRKRREVLADLRRQEISLNDAERKRRAAQRLQEIEESKKGDSAEAAAKREEAAQRQRQRDARHAEKAAKQQAREERAAAGSPREKEAGSALGRQPSASEAAANRREHEERLAQAKDRKQRVEARRAARAKPPASALPVPP